ncbi:MAG: nucleotidyl transferase AbiEii/AbiGii toxin family protein [Candidatus Omnitrophota bacterium]|jgi:predicted nucleotidyltransferase component of viral defense system
MIDVIKQLIAATPDIEGKLNRAREFLQIVILKILYDKATLDCISFTGGTALRILFDLRRFSEDMDFSLVKKEGYNFANIHQELISGLKLHGFVVEVKSNEENKVNSLLLRFSELLKPLGLSPLHSQKLAIKLEIDTNPPMGGHLVDTLVNKTYIFNVLHFDLPSLFATKLHACFYRKYTKGRDYYDFLWYTGKKIKPNYILLNNAITQTQGKTPEINEENLKSFLLKHIKQVDFIKVKQDVERFLEDKSELKLLELKTIKQAIEAAY